MGFRGVKGPMAVTDFNRLTGLLLPSTLFQGYQLSSMEFHDCILAEIFFSIGVHDLLLPFMVFRIVTK